jgi:hypothetical protein
MSGYSAIEDTGRALVALLESELQGITITGDPVVQLISPGDIAADDVHLSLYLFRVDESSHLKNAEPEIENGVARPPPQALDLYYLLTAHLATQDPETADSYQQHRILGRAIQVLHDNRVIRGAQSSGDDLHLSIDSQSTDELTGIWSTFANKPYQPSVVYLVTPVVIESEREDPVGRVAERQIDTYVRSTTTGTSPGGDGGVQ